MNCSVPSCGQTATLQWQRTASQAEHDRWAKVNVKQMQDALDQQSMNLHMQANQVRKFAQDQEETVRGHRLRDMANKQAEALLAQADTLPATVTWAPTEPSTAAVYACDAHAVTADRATLLHQVDCCSTTAGCQCPATTTGSKK